MADHGGVGGGWGGMGFWGGGGWERRGESVNPCLPERSHRVEPMTAESSKRVIGSTQIGWDHGLLHDIYNSL
jgi:hypothetical protein